MTAADDGGDRQHDHHQIERCSPADGVVLADRRWVGGIFQQRHDVQADESQQAEERGGPSGRLEADAAVRNAEHDREDPAHGDAIEDGAGAESGGVLHRAADDVVLGRLVVHVVFDVGLEGDGLVDVRLALPAGETERGETGEEPDEHPANEQAPHHGVRRSQWQGKPRRCRASCTHSWR